MTAAANHGAPAVKLLPTVPPITTSFEATQNCVLNSARTSFRRSLFSGSTESGGARALGQQFSSSPFRFTPVAAILNRKATTTQKSGCCRASSREARQTRWGAAVNFQTYLHLRDCNHCLFLANSAAGVLDTFHVHTLHNKLLKTPCTLSFERSRSQAGGYEPLTEYS